MPTKNRLLAPKPRRHLHQQPPPAPFAFAPISQISYISPPLLCPAGSLGLTAVLVFGKILCRGLRSRTCRQRWSFREKPSGNTCTRPRSRKRPRDSYRRWNLGVSPKQGGASGQAGKRCERGNSRTGRCTGGKSAPCDARGAGWLRYWNGGLELTSEHLGAVSVCGWRCLIGKILASDLGPFLAPDSPTWSQYTGLGLCSNGTSTESAMFCTRSGWAAPTRSF